MVFRKTTDVIITIKLNSYLFACKLNRPRVNYKVGTIWKKENEHMQNTNEGKRTS
jgi:hypothetical protein